MDVTAHASVSAPPTHLDLEQTGDGFELDHSAQPAASRVWRVGDRSGDPAPTVTPTDAPLQARTEGHAGTGAPDPRRGQATELTPPELAAAPVEYDNHRDLVVLSPEAPPERPRQGFTGADPTRAATYRRPIVMRLFDKLMAEHPGQLEKAYMAAPLATTSKMLADLPDAEPYAGGATGTQTEGVSTGRNSFRIMPRPWDALLVNTGGPAATPANPDPAYTAAAAETTRGRFR